MNSQRHPLNPLELASFGPVIPVIVVDRVEAAVPMAIALVAGGVRVLEVTLRTAAGLPAIAAIAREVPDAIVGIEIEVTRVEGKFKLSQNRSAEDRTGVVLGLGSDASLQRQAQADALAQAMQALEERRRNPAGAK